MIPRNVRKRYLTHQSAERVLLLGCRGGSKIPSCSEYVEEMSITKNSKGNKMTEKKVSYSYDGGHWIVELKGFHKYPKLSFFMRENDAKEWVEVLRERHNLKGQDK